MSDTPVTMPQTHKSILRWLFEHVWSEGDFERVAEHIAPQIKFHYRGQTFTQTPQDLVSIVQRWRSAFPDLRYEIGALLVEGDVAAARLTRTGTQRGAWRGVEPTGRQIQVDEVMFFRFENGQIVEVWEVSDEYAERKQLTAGDEEDR